MIKTKVLLILLLPYWVFTQEEVKGIVTNEISPMAFVNVFLTNHEKEIVAGTITEDDGSFNLNVEKGLYTINISFLGYANWTKSIEVGAVPIDLGSIVLQEEKNSLDEVVLISKKRTIERKVDRLVFNLANNIAAIGGNAIDALKMAPGIRIQDDEIIMIGKSGMKVLVDGRLIQLADNELTSYLGTISADDIDKIEIITNPPAKYEAEGNSGLINIIYKKGAKNSWSNSTTVTYTQGPYAYFDFGNNFYYNRNKVKFLVNFSSNFGDYQEIEDLNIFYSDGLWKTQLERIINQKHTSGRIEFDYQLTNKTTIGVQYLGTISEPDMSDYSNTEIFNSASTVDSLLITRGFNKDDTNNYALNLHLITKLDTIGRKISLDLDYFNYDSKQDRDFITNSTTATNNYLNLISSSRNIINQELSNLSGRLDIEHPTKKVNLSYGGKLSFSKNSNAPRYFDVIGETEVLDENLSDDFDYEEETVAGYFTAAKDFSEKWKMQLGLRYEVTTTKGISKTLNQTNKNEYSKMFPTFYLSYIKNDNNSFSINYGKRINRPSYSFLNPFRFVINSNMYSVGNPFLQPSFTDNIEFSHTYKGKLITNVYFSHTSDGFGPVFSIKEETNEQVISRENFYNQNSYGLTENYTFSPTSWWESQNTLNISYSDSDFYNKNVDSEEQNGIGFYLSSNNTFVINKAKTFKLQLNSWYNSAAKYYIFDNTEALNVDFSLRYSMMDNNLQMFVGIFDIFNSSPVKRTFYGNKVKQTYQMFSSNRYFRASLTYKFGNKKIKGKNRDFGNEEEKNRAGI